MILAIDIGNSKIIIGCMKGETPVFVERVSADMGRTDFEYAVQIKSLFEIYNINAKEIEGTIISSVVPPLVDVVISSVKKIINVPIKVVGPGIKTGLKIHMDNPAQVGSDLVVNAVAALKYYSSPLLIINVGTATTISCIDKEGSYTGGIIMPGIETSLDALTTRTAKLPKIELKIPKKCIGKNTVDSMKSGIIYGTVSSIDGLLNYLEEELGYECNKIATGLFAKKIIPYCKNEIVIDETLSLKGLGLIFEKNR